MIKGIFTSAAGMVPRMTQQEIIANNLANAATVGFKKDQVFLKTLLDASLLLNSGGDLNSMINEAQEVLTNFSQGGMRSTGNPLDLCLSGPGFFAVKTDEGTMYTRSGMFTLDPEGNLVTLSGQNVMGQGGPISLPHGDVVIAQNGAVLADGQEIDRLKVVDFSDKKALVKKADNLFAAGPGASETEALETVVNQGFLEESNVETIREMVEMITLYRTYQANARAIMAQDETLRRGITVGEIR